MCWFMPVAASVNKVLNVFVCVSACECVLFECKSSPRSFLLVSWCPLISWCCRGFQNGASGSGISFHCHDNDSDTLAPSNSDQPLYGNRNAISPAAATDNPLREWKVPKWLSIQARLRGQQPIKVGAAEQCHPKDLRLSLNTHIKQYQVAVFSLLQRTSNPLNYLFPYRPDSFGGIGSLR